LSFDKLRMRRLPGSIAEVAWAVEPLRDSQSQAALFVTAEGAENAKGVKEAELVLGDPKMSVDAQLIAGVVAIEGRLERLESQPQRRLLTDYDWLAGWKDDFFGQAIRAEYDQRTVGAGSSIALEDGAHGGVCRLTSGNVLSDYARIMLGDRTYVFDSLDPDELFWLFGIYKLSHTTSILVDLFLTDALLNRIHITADTDHGNNWYIRTDNNSGVDAWADSGIAIDTAWHEHWMEVRSGYVGHWMDGVLVNETTTKVPIVVMTASFRCLSRAAASRYARLDFWGAIPMRSQTA
jgi:hypothetical protein